MIDPHSIHQQATCNEQRHPVCIESIISHLLAWLVRSTNLTLPAKPFPLSLNESPKSTMPSVLRPSAAL